MKSENTCFSFSGLSVDKPKQCVVVAVGSSAVRGGKLSGLVVHRTVQTVHANLFKEDCFSLIRIPRSTGQVFGSTLCFIKENKGKMKIMAKKKITEVMTSQKTTSEAGMVVCRVGRAAHGSCGQPANKERQDEVKLARKLRRGPPHP